MTLGKELRRIRKQNKMSLKDLSAKSGLSVVAIDNYELENRKPTLTSLGKLSMALNCDYDYLYELLKKK